MELSLDLSKRYTYADYLTWMDNVRRELIEGFIKMMPAPRLSHAEVSRNITLHLGLYLMQNQCQCKVFYAPVDVRFPKGGETGYDKIDTIVQPDIFVVCDPSKLDEDGCCGAPDMIVEILSPSTAKKDMTEKFVLYEEHGVKEYWIVHPKDKAIHVFLMQADGKYDAGCIYERGGKIPVQVFDGYLLDLEALFKNS